MVVEGWSDANLAALEEHNQAAIEEHDKRVSEAAFLSNQQENIK